MTPKQTNWVTYSDEDELTDLSSDEEELDDDAPLVPASASRLNPPAPQPTPANSPVRSKSTRPSTQSATQKSRERRGLKSFTTNLRPGRNVNFAISSLNTWMIQDSLDLNAEYQRGIVWKEEKQSGLIDSLFNNFHIPPLVFVVNRHEDGSETRVCIDGKQRLTSIRRFIKGEIPYKDPMTNRKLYYTSTPGTRRKTITAIMQQNFNNKQIACFEYEDVTAAQEREIFQRVQLGVALTPAERLAAINGPYADLVRTMRKRITSFPGLATFLNWGSANGRNFQALAQILYITQHAHTPSKAEPNYKRLNTFLSQPHPAGAEDGTLPNLERSILRAVDVFCEIVVHPVLGAPMKEDFSVLEFAMSVYLVYVYHPKGYSAPQLSHAIEQMRAYVRKGCENTKFETKNFKYVLAFVVKQVPKLELKTTVGAGGVEGRGVAAKKMKQSRSETPGVPASASTSTLATTTAKKAIKKRKRVASDTEEDEENINNKDEDEDEDDEYIIPVKKKKRAPTAQSKKIQTQTQTQALLTPAPDLPPQTTKPKSKLAASTSRSASGSSKAKTTVKKSPKKGQASAATTGSTSASTAAKRKTSASSASLGNLQPSGSGSSSSIARSAPAPTGGAPAQMASSTFSFRAAPTPPLSSGSPAPPPSAPPTSTPARRPLPGRTTSASASPVIPQPVPQAFLAGPGALAPAEELFDSSVPVLSAHAGGIGNVDGNANAKGPPPARSGSSKDFLYPLRNAKAAKGVGVGVGGSSSSPNLGGASASASPSVGNLNMNTCAGGGGGNGSSGSVGGNTSSRPGNTAGARTGQGQGIGASSGTGTGSSTSTAKLPKFNKIQPHSPVVGGEDEAFGSANAPASGRPSLQVKPSGGQMASAQVLVPYATGYASSASAGTGTNFMHGRSGSFGEGGALATPASTPSPVLPAAASWFATRPPQGQVTLQSQAAAFAATKDPRTAWRIIQNQGAEGAGNGPSPTTPTPTPAGIPGGGIVDPSFAGAATAGVPPTIGLKRSLSRSTSNQHVQEGRSGAGRAR